MIEEALELLRAGFSVIPIKSDGSKAPALSSWAEFQERRPEEREVRHWFGKLGHKGIGIICGPISGNLVVIDFESREVFSEWLQIVKLDGINIDEFPIIETPRGNHVYLRLEQAENHRTLAYTIDKDIDKDGKKNQRKVLIETRARGNYVVGPGSPPECHSSHKHGWIHKFGPLLPDTPRASKDTWGALLRAAKVFNKVVPERRSSRITGTEKISKDDQRPGTDYIQRSTEEDFAKLLTKHEWELWRESRSGGSIWRRPGKIERGGSATLGQVETEGGAIFHVFSTNAYPFEADKTYSIFAARALLEFGGDYSRCADQCLTEGFGKPPAQELRAEVEEYVEHWKNSANLESLQNKIDNISAGSLTFKKTWERRREKDFGNDAHRYCRSLLYQAVSSLGSPDESGLRVGIGLVKLWRQKFNLEVYKAEDVDYLARQAADILAKRDRTELDALSTLEAQEAGESNAGRLKWLSDRLGGIPVQGFYQQRLTADEATYWIDVDGHLIKLGDIKSWEKYENFERVLRGWASPSGECISGFRGTLPQKLAPRVAWKGIIEVLYLIRKVSGEKDTLHELIFDWCLEYGIYYGAFEEEEEGEKNWQELADSGYPFCLDEKLWVGLDEFLRFINVKKDRLNRNDLIDIFKTAGFSRTQKSFSTDRGIWYSRRYWTVEVSRLSNGQS